MGGMTQALRTRPSAGTRRQGNRVLGIFSPGTSRERPRLCNKDANSGHTAQALSEPQEQAALRAAPPQWWVSELLPTLEGKGHLAPHQNPEHTALGGPSSHTPKPVPPKAQVCLSPSPARPRVQGPGIVTGPG